MDLNALKKIYFLGIGGIGMSALARYFNKKGVEIHGYDKTKTPLTRRLAKEGMHVHYDENTGFIPPDIDLAIWTPAVPREHKAFEWFEKNNVPLKKRAEVLGMISQNLRTIAVAGTHGKTTTSSLIAHLLHVGGVDATAFLGGIAQNFDSNFVGGKGEWAVAEADEYDRSFLQLSPEIAVLLSMDADHLDIYGDAGSVAETGFKEFLKKTKPSGKVFIKHNLIQNFDNQLFEKAESGQWKVDGVTYSTFGLEQGAYRSENIRVENGWFVFDFVAPVAEPSWEAKTEPGNRNGRNGDRSYEGQQMEDSSRELGIGKLEMAAKGVAAGRVEIKNLRLGMPGRHNVENATAAIAVALQLGVSPLAIRKALLTFKGIKRRFEIVYRDEKVVFIDDYAHHPTEIQSAVQAARELFPGRSITGIFQPHLFTRTRDFQDGFAEELDKLDHVILLDIYPAREEPIPGITSEVIFEKMQNPNKHLVAKGDLLKLVKNWDFDVLLTIGAGDIDMLVEPIQRLLIKGKK